MFFRSTGDVIHKIRTNKGLSDLDLSRKAGLKVKKLRNIESGEPPTKKDLEAICESLNAPVEIVRFLAGEISDEFKDEILEKPSKSLESIKDTLEIDTLSSKVGESGSNKEQIQPDFETDLGKLYQGDCRQILPRLNSKFDLIFADPPFNLEKNYGTEIEDDLSEEEYINWSIGWIKKAVPLLKSGGALFLFNLPKWNIHLAHYLAKHLTFKHWITIDLRFSLPIPNQLYPAHYSLLYFIKGNQPKHFSPPRLPVETCKHCGGEQHDYGGYKDKMNPEGVNLTDIWNDIPPVRHNRYKNRDANELSIKLLHRILEISTKPGDMVLDPFGGAGTTYAASEIMNREWVGVELANLDPIIERLNNLKEDRQQIEKFNENQNVLFTKDALKKRAKYRDIFGFNFKDYDLDKSPTEEIEHKLPFESN